MAKGILHLHVTVVTIFLLFLIFKTILLLAGKTETLGKVRDKTKIVDMVLGILILITGGYLVYATRFETYILVKIVVTLIGIPLGIVAFKKQIKALAVLSVICFIYVYGVAETKTYKFKQDKIAIADSSANQAQAIFVQECATCHGQDGKLGKAGAKDLTQTQLKTEEIESTIANGKPLMPAYKKRLSEQEIKALAEYVQSL